MIWSVSSWTFTLGLQFVGSSLDSTPPPPPSPTSLFSGSWGKQVLVQMFQKSLSDMTQQHQFNSKVTIKVCQVKYFLKLFFIIVRKVKPGFFFKYYISFWRIPMCFVCQLKGINSLQAKSKKGNCSKCWLKCNTIIGKYKKSHILNRLTCRNWDIWTLIQTIRAFPCNHGS